MVVGSIPRVCVCVFYLYSIRLISFIIYVPRPLRNEILDHSISKGWCVTRKMSQSVRNIFRDYWKILFHIKVKHMVKMYSLNKLFELKFSGKTSEEKYAASLGTKAKRFFFLNICDYFKKYVKSTEIQLHISSVR